MQIAAKLWAANIRTLVPQKMKVKIGDVLGQASDAHVPFAVIFGSDELKAGIVKIKDLASKEESECAMSEIAEQLLKKLGRL